MDDDRLVWDAGGLQLLFVEASTRSGEIKGFQDGGTERAFVFDLVAEANVVGDISALAVGRAGQRNQSLTSG